MHETLEHARARGSTPTVELELDMRDGLSPQETLRRAQRSLRVGEASARVTAYYLADLADNQGYLELGHPSMAHCIEHRFRESPGTIWAYVSVGRALRELPQVDAALAAGRVSWSVAKLLVGVVTPETEQAWVEWAEGRSWRQVRREVQRRNKGDLPAAAGTRTLHHVTVRFGARLTRTEYEVARRAQAKLEAETGQPISVRQMLVEASRLILATRPDGSIPGRVPVCDRHYLIHAAPRSTTEPELVAEGADGELVPLDLHELTAPPLARSTIETVALDEPATSDPRNSGPLVPEAERDVATPPALRAEVLYRDGYRCRSCGSQKNLSCHHLHWRSYGGRTVAENLLTLCENCHSLVHARMLVILGDLSDGLQFVDREGIPRDAAEPPRAFHWTLAPVGSRGETSPAAPVVQLRDLPAEVDCEWWRRHQGLLSWNERQGELVLRPGIPPEAPPPEITCETAPARRLDGVVGQDRLRERLKVAVAAARRAGEPLAHLLFTGAAGLGKTHLAEAVAGELGAALLRLPAPLVRSPDVLLRALTSLPAGAVLFMDELHALPRRAAEVLYEALDTRTLSLPLRQGLELRPLRLRLRPFTLVAATTDEDQLPAPLLSRLESLGLELPSQEHLRAILQDGAREQGFELTPKAAARLASASRDNPRRALQLLKAVRREVTVSGVELAGPRLIRRVLRREGVDRGGCTPLDRAYLAQLEAAPRPLGLSTLAARVGTSERVLRETCEPFLLRKGRVLITPHGRVASSGGT